MKHGFPKSRCGHSCTPWRWSRVTRHLSPNFHFDRAVANPIRSPSAHIEGVFSPRKPRTGLLLAVLQGIRTQEPACYATSVTEMAQVGSRSGSVLRPFQFPLQIVKRYRKPFDGGDWVFEIKHDGFRVVGIRDGGPTRLFTRNGYDISAKHPHIIGQLNGLPAKRFVIDGELVVLDSDGRSNFARLMFGRSGTHYFAFDLLWLENTDLRLHLLEGRKSILQELLRSADPVRYCDHVAGCGKAFYENGPRSRS